MIIEHRRRCPHLSAEKKEAQQSDSSSNDDPQLPKREIAFYLIAFVSIVTYAGFGFYQAYGINPAESLHPALLKTGWIRDYMDIGENRLMESALIHWKCLIASSIGFLAVSKITLLWTPKAIHQMACGCYTIAMITLAVSPQVSAFFLALNLFGLGLSYFSFKAIWFVVASLLYLHTLEVFWENVILMLFFVSTDYTLSIYAAFFGYFICRLVSMGHTLRTNLTQLKEKGHRVPTLIEHLWNNFPSSMHYMFYMPYNWCGPILTYNMFMERVETRGRVATVDKSTALEIAWRICRLLVWLCVLELIYHFLPVLSYLHSLNWEDEIVYKHMSFSLYMHGQNFMLVYVQFYGWPAVLARMDGIKLLDWPDCISRVYSYTIMWRVFDRGLFVIMRDHLYFPLGGSRHGVPRQILAVLATFAFIGIFHGNTANVQTWVTLNALQLILERTATFCYKAYLRSIVMKCLSPRNEKRLVGYIISWNMMVSIGIIFFFLAGMNGFIVMPEFLLLRPASWHTPVWHMLTFQFATYCAVQIAIYFENFECKRRKEKVS